MIKASSNIKAFQASLKAKMRATSKTEAEVCTKAALDVAYRSASFTQKRTAAELRRRLLANDLVWKLASRNLKKKQGRYTRAELIKEAKRLLAKAARAAGAVRASWAGAIIALGGKWRGKRPKPGTESAKGTGRKANPRNLLAFIKSAIVTTSGTGRVTSASEIQPLVYALDQAVGFVAHDMMNYARKKIRQALNKK